MIESELNQRFKFILKNTPEAESAKKVGEVVLTELTPADMGIDSFRPLI